MFFETSAISAVLEHIEAICSAWVMASCPLKVARKRQARQDESNGRRGRRQNDELESLIDVGIESEVDPCTTEWRVSEEVLPLRIDEEEEQRQEEREGDNRGGKIWTYVENSLERVMNDHGHWCCWVENDLLRSDGRVGWKERRETSVSLGEEEDASPAFARDSWARRLPRT